MPKQLTDTDLCPGCEFEAQCRPGLTFHKEHGEDQEPANDNQDD